MTKMIKLLIPIVLIIILCSCAAKNSAEQIVGKWELDQDSLSEIVQSIRVPNAIHFFSDGSVQSDNLGGQYTIDGNSLIISYSAMDTYTYIFDIQKDVLTIKSDDIYASESQVYVYYREGSGASINDNYNFGTENDIDDEEDTTEPENLLSDECDRVLAQGTDINGDFYQLVATQEETYNSVEIKVGVIKNNEWLVELSSDSPFIDSESGLLWYYDYYTYKYHLAVFTLNNMTSSNITSSYDFIGNGCFYHQGLFYNSNTQEFFKENCDGEESIDDRYTIPYTFYGYGKLSNGNQQISDIENVLICDDGYAGSRIIRLVNTSTMKVTSVAENCDFFPKAPFSEGLFYGCFLNNFYSYVNKGFYNIKGEKIIDLEEYNIANTPAENDNDFELIFIDGKCIFTVANEAGHLFKITIDKSGNVISQEAIES